MKVQCLEGVTFDDGFDIFLVCFIVLTVTKTKRFFKGQPFKGMLHIELVEFWIYHLRVRSISLDDVSWHFSGLVNILARGSCPPFCHLHTDKIRAPIIFGRCYNTSTIDFPSTTPTSLHLQYIFLIDFRAEQLGMQCITISIPPGAPGELQSKYQDNKVAESPKQYLTRMCETCSTA